MVIIKTTNNNVKFLKPLVDLIEDKIKELDDSKGIFDIECSFMEDLPEIKVICKGVK